MTVHHSCCSCKAACTLNTNAAMQRLTFTDLPGIRQAKAKAGTNGQADDVPAITHRIVEKCADPCSSLNAEHPRHRTVMCFCLRDHDDVYSS